MRHYNLYNLQRYWERGLDRIPQMLRFLFFQFFHFCLTVCGRTLQESVGEFSHKPSSSNEMCQWRISATHGEKIVLNITLMDIPDSLDCVTDYLEIRDGHFVKSTLLGRCLSIHFQPMHRCDMFLK